MDKKSLEQKAQRDKWAKWQHQVLDYVSTNQEHQEQTQKKSEEQATTKAEIEAMIQKEAERIANSQTISRVPVYRHGQYDQVIDRIKKASRQTGNWQTF